MGTLVKDNRIVFILMLKQMYTYANLIIEKRFSKSERCSENLTNSSFWKGWGRRARVGCRSKENIALRLEFYVRDRQSKQG